MHGAFCNQPWPGNDPRDHSGVSRVVWGGDKGPSYRVEKNMFSENQKSKLGFDWSECQHATHGDFDISEILFSAKKSWGTFS